MISRFVANSEKMSQINVLGGSAQIITILHGGGGYQNLLQYYMGGGGFSRDPKFVLRNIWTAPNPVFGSECVPKEPTRSHDPTSIECSNFKKNGFIKKLFMHLTFGCIEPKVEPIALLKSLVGRNKKGF